VRDILDKKAPNSSLRFTVEGEYYVDYAWDARTGLFADKVTPEQSKLFEQRLKLAASALEKAWELDKTNYWAAMRRITVAKGLGGPREVMERWFERATKAKPDTLHPYWAKLDYLEPKWHGSRDGREMLEFGRECVKGGNYKARIPFILIEAHMRLAQYPRGDRTFYSSKPDPGHFKEPGVWEDVRSVFEPYLKQSPDAHRDRSSYARLACWCFQWKEAKQQFRTLGDNLDRSAFESEEELTLLRNYAEERGGQ
jgi:hypothetical protein